MSNLPRGLDEVTMAGIEKRAKQRDEKADKEDKKKKARRKKAIELNKNFEKKYMKKKAKRKPSPWIRALKEWNEDKNRTSGKNHWCVPRKGSKGYKVVTALSETYKKKGAKKKLTQKEQSEARLRKADEQAEKRRRKNR